MKADWRDRAACAGTADESFATHDPFFPESHGEAPEAYETARAFCRRCPVMVSTECLQAVLAVEGLLPPKARHGMAGGMTPRERANLARREAGRLRGRELMWA